MSAPEVSPERRAEMVRMALAEAGWPDAEVGVWPDTGEVAIVTSGPRGVPEEAVWTVWAVTDPDADRCFVCWINDWRAEDCDHPLWDNAPDLRSVAR